MKCLYKLFLCCVLLICEMTACSKKMLLGEMPYVGVPTSEMNKRISVWAPPEINSYRTKDFLQLAVKINGSQYQVALKPNFSIRIFIKQDEQWVETKNLVKYPGLGDESEYSIFLTTRDAWSKEAITFVWPELPDITKTTMVRFIVVGKIIQNGKYTDENTGAYVDIELKP